MLCIIASKRKKLKIETKWGFSLKRGYYYCKYRTFMIQKKGGER